MVFELEHETLIVMAYFKSGVYNEINDRQYFLDYYVQF